MELDNLVISFLDVEANKGVFRRELAKTLKILPSDIDVWFESEYTGTMHQYIVVKIRERLSKDDLDKLDFDFLDEDGFLVWEVGDIVL
jgi:hypothetical protein